MANAAAAAADIVIIRESRGSFSPLILDIVTAASTKHNTLGSFCSAASSKVAMKVRTYSHYAIPQGCFWPVSVERSGAFPPATDAFLEFVRSSFSLPRSQIASMAHVISRSIHVGMAQVVSAYAHRSLLNSTGMPFPSTLAAMQANVRAHDDRRAASARRSAQTSERARIFSPAPLPPHRPPPPPAPLAPSRNIFPPAPAALTLPSPSSSDLAAWTFFSKEELRDICHAVGLSPSGDKLALATSLFRRLGPSPPLEIFEDTSAATRATAARLPASLTLSASGPVNSPASPSSPPPSGYGFSDPGSPSAPSPRRLSALPSLRSALNRPLPSGRAPSPEHPPQLSQLSLYSRGRAPRSPRQRVAPARPPPRNLHASLPASGPRSPSFPRSALSSPLSSSSDGGSGDDFLMAPAALPLSPTGLPPPAVLPVASAAGALGGVPLPWRMGLLERGVRLVTHAFFGSTDVEGAGVARP